jgi:phage terminase small subunit|tara:strand:- start:218 stop:841 length:624 start_codon:yes stop_codon:yes gene_type:complete
MKEIKSLTKRQEKFVEEFLKTPTDAVGATKRAGFKNAPEYSARLQRTPKIADAIERRRGEIAESEGIDAEWLAKHYKAIIETPITDLCYWDQVNGVVTKSSEQINKFSALSIKEVIEAKSKEDSPKKIILKQESKLEAMRDLRAMLGMDAPKRQEVKATTENYNMDIHGDNDKIANNLLTTLEKIIEEPEAEEEIRSPAPRGTSKIN